MILGLVKLEVHGKVAGWETNINNWQVCHYSDGK